MSGRQQDLRHAWLDCWTSPCNEAYLGVTGHYIDKGWAMQSLLLLLDFVLLEGEHTGESLCGVVNLAVQAFLCELKAEDSVADADPGCAMATQTAGWSCIAKLRYIVRWIRSSPQNAEHFKDLCKDGLGSKKAILDSPHATRWNSTYTMIKRALELRDPLSRLMGTARQFPVLSKMTSDSFSRLPVRSLASSRGVYSMAV